MTTIVDQLLDATQARLGRGIPLQVRDSSLISIVKGVIDELVLVHAKTRIKVTGDDVTGLWDPDRLAQVFSNLLSNAAAYGDPTGPVVVELGTRDDGVTIHVRNPLRDAPIPPELQARLFDPYLRGGSHARRAKGLGLGLYIVREIVRAHGGTIEVSSTPAGTIFAIWLPRRRPEP